MGYDTTIDATKAAKLAASENTERQTTHWLLVFPENSNLDNTILGAGSIVATNVVHMSKKKGKKLLSSILSWTIAKQDGAVCIKGDSKIKHDWEDVFDEV